MTQLHLETVGRGETPLVLLHGIPGTGATWLPVAERLAADHQLLIADLVGFGASGRSDDLDQLHAEGQATALELALAAAGVQRAVFVGHDFGGPVALTLLGRRPDLFAGLALVATNAFTDTPIPMPIRAATWPVVGGPAGRLLFSPPALRLMLRASRSTPRHISATAASAAPSGGSSPHRCERSAAASRR